MTKIDLSNLFDKGMELHTITNTAYPLTPTSIKQYAIRDNVKIKNFLKKEFQLMNELSLYVHVPFCKTKCKFCEYVVVSGSENDLKDEYTNAVINEIDLYEQIISADQSIVGFDIGGGTPTELGYNRIEKIVHKLSKSFSLKNDQVWSIETTPYNAVYKSDELKLYHNLGFHRISMGIQTVNTQLLCKMEREGDLHLYRKATDAIRNAGYTQFNIDLMFGFKDQSIADFKATLEYTVSLGPEYITLYEMRYKLTKIAIDGLDVSQEKVNMQYRIAYEILISNGYMANYGKNTFSKIAHNHGTSNYLTNRVIKATPYLGLGAGAQSFGLNYLAYNYGAASKSIIKYMETVHAGQLPIQDFYDLPEQEVMAKAISVMFYFGFIDLEHFKKRFGKDFTQLFKHELAFLNFMNLAEVSNGMFKVNENGVEHLSGVIPMFYSDRSKQELMEININKFLK